MITMLPLFLLLIAPSVGQNVPNILSLPQIFGQKQAVKQEIDGYFNQKDTTSLEDICQMFFDDYNKEICQMEGGTRGKNKNGFEEASDKLTPSEASGGWLDLVTKITSQSSHDNEAYLQETNTCDNEYIPFEQDLNYNKTITVLVADPDFSTKDFRKAQDALFNFNVCTEDHANFEFDTYMVNVLEEDRGVSWDDATLTVLNAAEEMGINIEPMVDGERRMTMIILPDHVYFYGYYGFAVLHYGLSVIKATAAKKSSNIVHELGHNFGMLHSASPRDEYGDDRCLMGDAKNNYVCFNGAKSYFLGLYRDFTAEFGITSSACQVTVDMVDLDYHLYTRNKFIQIYDQYYVVVAVHARRGGNDEFLYMMYYSDEDIISITKGEFGIIADDAGNRLPYAAKSLRMYDLAAGESYSYENVRFERVASETMARVTITFDS